MNSRLVIGAGCHSSNSMKLLFALVTLALSLPVFAEEPPTKFVTQVLTQAGGKIPRPESWHYQENVVPWRQMWTISREEIPEDPTEDFSLKTGVVIQSVIQVEASTGKNAKQTIIDFIKERRATTKVIRTCREKVIGEFTYTCLEVEDGPHHVLYSLYWGTKDLDIAIFSTAMTTKELWQTYAATFEKMSEFELYAPRLTER